jgi:hypothetical protein
MSEPMDPIGQIMDQDPYLAYQPAFAYTLPIQLFVNGITVTLLVVLCIHLLCQSYFLSFGTVRSLPCLFPLPIVYR